MRLLAIGAGPKGIAVAAKAAVLAGLGQPAPEVVMVDPGPPAAHWDGGAGYTDGRQRLGTPPHKDVGFPYAPSWGANSAGVNASMLDLSWPAYLVDRQEYAEWVDRGSPRPLHRKWADYLRWTVDRAGLRVRRGEVVGVDATEEWEITVRTDDGVEILAADGLLVTGPGAPLTLPGQPENHPRVLDGRGVWMALERLRADPPRQVCVVGGGETAGAAAAALVDLVPADGTVEVISREGVLYTRGESYTENHRYSDPTSWLALPEHVRRSFLRRTDRGVFSTGVQATLDGAENLRTVMGTVVAVDAGENRVVVGVDDGTEVSHVAYDLVVIAVGFDPLWFLPLLTPTARSAFDAAVAAGPHRRDGLQHAVEDVIEADLSIRGLRPRLHLPTLAGVAQGAGFPNLSCLGLLADRVLGPYVSTATDHLTTQSGMGGTTGDQTPGHAASPAAG